MNISTDDLNEFGQARLEDCDIPYPHSHLAQSRAAGMARVMEQ